VLDAEVVEDGANVVDPLLERGHLGGADSVGQPEAAPVEDDDAGEARRCRNRTSAGSSQYRSSCETQPGTHTRSGPAPNAW